MHTVQNAIAMKTHFPSPPVICIKILDLVRRDDFTFQNLADVIVADPSLTAKLLKLANTPGYNISGSVTSVEKAVAILGANAVKIIALSFVVYTEFQKDTGGTFDTDLFWRKSLTAAVASEQIAKSMTGSGGDLFLIALLQDIGVIIMSNWQEHDYRLISKGARDENLLQHKLENDLYGFDHATLGAELFKSWNFPEEIYLPIQYHHTGETSPEHYRSTIKILECANLLSSFYNDAHDVAKIRSARKLLTSELGFSEQAAHDLIESVALGSSELFSAFEISSGRVKPLSQILQEANEELGSLYDSYELILLDLKQAKEKSDTLARELHEANEWLRKLAYKDDLTQIYNFRYFHEALDREFDRSKRYGRNFSIILFDLDDLKIINDTHGHLVGSQLLVNISRIVLASLRGTDIFARLGGDEFGIILLETDAASASFVAEQIRRSIESSTETIPATISVGLTTFSSDKLDCDKKTIFKTADEALYLAKKCGKNCVRIG